VQVRSKPISHCLNVNNSRGITVDNLHPLLNPHPVNGIAERFAVDRQKHD
jgi:hypothetical protein